MTTIAQIGCGPDPGFVDISCDAEGGGGETPLSGLAWYEEVSGYFAIAESGGTYQWSLDGTAFSVASGTTTGYVMAVDGNALSVEAT